MVKSLESKASADQAKAGLKYTHIEETIFYPAAREAVPDTGEHVLESVEEHHVVAWMLSELMHLDPADERYDAKMTVLMENVRHHVEEEEEELLPQSEEILGDEELARLGEEMAARKKQLGAD